MFGEDLAHIYGILKSCIDNYLFRSKIVANATNGGKKNMKDLPDRFSYGRCFSIIYRHGKTINDRMIRKFNLSGGQSRYLALICENPGISQESLVQYYQIDKGAIAKSIRRMEELGYIRREQNPEDRRAYCIFPTEKAHEVMDFCREDMRRMEKNLEQSLSKEEIQTFQELLGRITDNIQKYTEDYKEEDKSL